MRRSRWVCVSIYNGITHDNLLQPRLGVSYFVKRTNTILRGSYTRNFETPYNENLILSSTTGAGGLANGILGDTSNQPLLPGRRNQFNVGFQQALGKYVIFDGDYFNKRTTNAYDFNVSSTRPWYFRSRGGNRRLMESAPASTLRTIRAISLYGAGHSRARYFPPRAADYFNSDLPSGVFQN